MQFLGGGVKHGPRDLRQKPSGQKLLNRTRNWVPAQSIIEKEKLRANLPQAVMIFFEKIIDDIKDTFSVKLFYSLVYNHEEQFKVRCNK